MGEIELVVCTYKKNKFLKKKIWKNEKKAKRPSINDVTHF